MATIDAANGLAEQRGDGDGLDLRSMGLRDGIGGDDLLDMGGGEALVCQIADDCVGDAGVDPFCAVFVEDFRGSAKGSGGLCHVIDEDDVAAFYFSDDVHCLDARCGNAVFRDDGEFCTKCIRVGAGHFDAADIG